jgi:hypothetical protein
MQLYLILSLPQYHNFLLSSHIPSSQKVLLCSCFDFRSFGIIFSKVYVPFSKVYEPKCNLLLINRLYCMCKGSQLGRYNFVTIHCINYDLSIEIAIFHSIILNWTTLIRPKRPHCFFCSVYFNIIIYFFYYYLNIFIHGSLSVACFSKGRGLKLLKRYKTKSKPKV